MTDPTPTPIELNISGRDASSNGLAGQAGALATAFGDLGIPKVLLAAFLSLVTTIIALYLFWFGMVWLLTDLELFNWGWLNWLLDAFTSIALFFVVLLTFPTILLLVSTLFLEMVVKAVEARHYPDLPPARTMPIGELVFYVIKFTLFVLVLNLIALPFYLALPFLNFVLSWLIHGFIASREYYELVALRRNMATEMRALRRANSGRIFSSGFIIAMLMTVPFLNLLMPIIGAAYMTHVYHSLNKSGEHAGDTGTDIAPATQSTAATNFDADLMKIAEPPVIQRRK